MYYLEQASTRTVGFPIGLVRTWREEWVEAGPSGFKVLKASRTSVSRGQTGDTEWCISSAVAVSSIRFEPGRIAETGFGWQQGTLAFGTGEEFIRSFGTVGQYDWVLLGLQAKLAIAREQLN